MSRYHKSRQKGYQGCCHQDCPRRESTLEMLGVDTQRVLSSVHNCISFSSTCLLKTCLPPLPLCHKEEVLFLILYQLKLINCPQAVDACLESPFCSWPMEPIIKQQFPHLYKTFTGWKLEIFYTYSIHSLFFAIISSFICSESFFQGCLRM